MKKTIKQVAVSCLLIFVISYLFLNSGFSFTKGGAIKHIGRLYKYNVKIMNSTSIDIGEFVAYEYDETTSFYGYARLYKVFNVLYKAKQNIPFVKNDFKPFQVFLSISNDNNTIGIKINDSKIKYIATGSEKENYSPNKIYDLTYDYVKSKPDIYELIPIKNGYGILIDNKDPMAYSVRGFDEKGIAIADWYYGSDERYIK
jgi:hypothetical protein